MLLVMRLESNQPLFSFHAYAYSQMEDCDLAEIMSHRAFRECGALFGIEADIDDFLRRVDHGDPERERKGPTPSIPQGWRYEPAPDGIGVLAPADKFAAEEPTLPFTAAAAEKSLTVGHPATALLGIRRTLWTDLNIFDDEITERLAPTWIRAYEALGRPLLAQIVRARLAGKNGD